MLRELKDDKISGLDNTIDHLNAENTIYEKYLQEYTNALKISFLTALGQFDPKLEVYGESDWIIFILCCIFNIIVLLNLLIAIISETYTEISERKDLTGYKEKVLQIGFMQDSVFGLLKSSPDPT